MILNDLYKDARSVVMAQMGSDLHDAMDHVIVLDESADETDDDDGHSRQRVGCAGWVCRAGIGDGKDEAKNKRNNTD
jgi:hypothetical protein